MNSITVTVDMAKPLNVNLALAKKATETLIADHDPKVDGITLSKVSKVGSLWTLVYDVVPGRYTMGNFRSYKRYFQKGVED